MWILNGMAPLQRIVKKSIFVGCLSYPVDVVLGILLVNILGGGGGEGGVNMDNENGDNYCGDNI